MSSPVRGLTITNVFDSPINAIFPFSSTANSSVDIPEASNVPIP